MAGFGGELKMEWCCLTGLRDCEMVLLKLAYLTDRDLSSSRVFSEGQRCYSNESYLIGATLTGA